MSTTLGLVKGKGNTEMIVGKGFLVFQFNVLPTCMYVHCVCRSGARVIDGRELPWEC